jgi:hypothetical protein
MPSGTPIEARTPTEAAAIFRQNLIDVSQTVLFSGLSGLLASGIDLWRINAEFEMIGLPFRLVAAEPEP